MRRISAAAKEHLERVIIPFWTGLKDAQYGGFYGYMGQDLVLRKQAEKGCILNSRILWFFSEAAMALDREDLRQYADHAYEFMVRHCIDRVNGGIFWSMTFDGKPLDTTKHTYNQAFAVYALSAYYRLTGKEEPLKLARELFDLIEKRCTDEIGYLEAFTAQWHPESNEKLSENGILADKTMNTLLHVFAGGVHHPVGGHQQHIAGQQPRGKAPGLHLIQYAQGQAAALRPAQRALPQDQRRAGGQLHQLRLAGVQIEYQHVHRGEHILAAPVDQQRVHRLDGQAAGCPGPKEPPQQAHRHGTLPAGSLTAAHAVADQHQQALVIKHAAQVAVAAGHTGLSRGAAYPPADPQAGPADKAKLPSQRTRRSIAPAKGLAEPPGRLSCHLPGPAPRLQRGDDLHPPAAQRHHRFHVDTRSLQRDGGPRRLSVAQPKRRALPAGQRLDQLTGLVELGGDQPVLRPAPQPVPSGAGIVLQHVPDALGDQPAPSTAPAQLRRRFALKQRRLPGQGHRPGDQVAQQPRPAVAAALPASLIARAPLTELTAQPLHQLMLVGHLIRRGITLRQVAEGRAQRPEPGRGGALQPRRQPPGIAGVRLRLRHSCQHPGPRPGHRGDQQRSGPGADQPLARHIQQQPHTQHRATGAGRPRRP